MSRQSRFAALRGVFYDPHESVMTMNDLFINPQTGILRSGWRALFYLGIVLSPMLLAPLVLQLGTGETAAAGGAQSLLNPVMAFVYLAMIGWMAVVAWVCLKFLERLSWPAFGLAFHQGWGRDLGLGFLLSSVMIVATVVLQLPGGTRIHVNPLLAAEGRRILFEIFFALCGLLLAAAFEEVAFRGYAFQTLLRGAPAIVPILFFSILFGIGHWDNPNRTIFSTLNTVLAGIWLAVAYLKTRSLWFPIGLHVGWNWTMGAVFGIPISGMAIPEQALLVSTAGHLKWLTGGTYGSEGGAAATAVFTLATILISRSSWFSIAFETEQALAREAPNDETIRLSLQ
jgi:hypothetical protein